MMEAPGLGDRVREIVSGHEGTVTGFCEYLWGCEQFLVYLTGRTDKEGNPKSEWFDVGRLEVLERGVVKKIEYDRQSNIAPWAEEDPKKKRFFGADREAPIR